MPDISEASGPARTADVASERGASRSSGTADTPERVIEISGCWLAAGGFVILLIIAAGAGLWLGGFFDGSGSAGEGSAEAAVPVALVNGETITQQELDNLVWMNVALTPLTSGQPMNTSPQAIQQLRQRLLPSLINNRLVLQEAQKAGITVPEERIATELEAFPQQYGITQEQLDQQLQQAGVGRQVLRKWLRGALVANTYLQQNVYTGLTDPTEQQQAYQAWLSEVRARSDIQVYSLQPQQQQ